MSHHCQADDSGDWVLSMQAANIQKLLCQRPLERSVLMKVILCPVLASLTDAIEMLLEILHAVTAANISSPARTCAMVIPSIVWESSQYVICTFINASSPCNSIRGLISCMHSAQGCKSWSCLTFMSAICHAACCVYAICFAACWICSN